MRKLERLQLGQIGYIGEEEIYGSMPAWLACIRASLYASEQEARLDRHGSLLEVYYNPDTYKHEVIIPDDLTITQHPGSALLPDFIRVILVDTRGNRYIIVPEDRRRWPTG